MILVKYGSSARGEIDRYSDEDILAVGRFVPGIAPAHAIWYTRHRLCALKATGSLFLMHLKYDSTVLQDEDGWFRSFCEKIEPIQCSKDELLRVKECLVCFLSMQPSRSLIYWWHDVLYVLLRDFLIEPTPKTWTPF